MASGVYFAASQHALTTRTGQRGAARLALLLCEVNKRRRKNATTRLSVLRYSGCICAIIGVDHPAG